MAVLIDGVVYGGVKGDQAAEVVKQLRLLKTTGGTGDSSTRLDPTIELAHIPVSPGGGGAYPGLYIFTQPGRMIRPVLHLGMSIYAHGIKYTHSLDAC